MQPTIHVLSAGFRRQGDVSKIRSLYEKAMQRIVRRLSIGQNVDVVFQVSPQATIPEIGIGGYTPDAHTVYISLDPSHKNFNLALREELPRTLAHELHHAVRWHKPGYGSTLEEALVTEGLAAHFELEVFGGKPNMWDNALRGQKLKRLLRRAQREFASSAYNHNDWFFGNEKRSIPRWTGYSVGFEIVKTSLRQHPQWSASQLVHAEASSVLSTK